MREYRYLKLVIDGETYVCEQDDAAIDIPATVNRVYREEKVSGWVSKSERIEGQERERILALASKGWRV